MHDLTELRSTSRSLGNYYRDHVALEVWQPATCAGEPVESTKVRVFHFEGYLGRQ